MHSQPRLKLPAERLPKLERKKDLRNTNCEFRLTLQMSKNKKQNSTKKYTLKTVEDRETISNHYLPRMTRNHSNF